MGYTDKINALKKDVRLGNITAEKDMDSIIIAGNTYKHSSFLKSQFKGTDLHWDKDREVWVLPLKSMYSGDIMRVEDCFEIEVSDDEIRK